MDGFADVRKCGWRMNRHWAVMYRCTRCGRIDYVEYDGTEPNLQCQTAPQGWRDLSYMLFCPSCAESYEKWMEVEA